MIADYTWYMIFRETVGEPAHYSRGGIIDAVAAESEEEAIKTARRRNPVRDCEYLEAKPLTRPQWEKAREVRRRRHNDNVEFKRLMESMGLLLEDEELGNVDPV